MKNPYRQFLKQRVQVTFASGAVMIGLLWSLTQRTGWLIQDDEDVFITLTDIQAMELAV